MQELLEMITKVTTTETTRPPRSLDDDGDSEDGDGDGFGFASKLRSKSPSPNPMNLSSPLVRNTNRKRPTRSSTPVNTTSAEHMGNTQ